MGARSCGLVRIAGACIRGGLALRPLLEMVSKFVYQEPLMPRGSHLSCFAKKGNPKKATPTIVLFLRCSEKSGTARTRYAQIAGRSDRFFLPLLGANQRGPVEPIFDRFAMRITRTRMRASGLHLLVSMCVPNRCRGRLTVAVPKFDDLFNPLLTAMHKLGGSASISEQEDEVAALLKLSDSDISEIQSGSRTKMSYRLAWARNWLKHYGLLGNSARGIWALTPLGQQTLIVDKTGVKKAVNALARTQRSGSQSTAQPQLDEELIEDMWEDKLLETIRRVSPDAFERLCQRVLRESGFIHVEVTGRVGDGGIDGKGVVRVGGLLSFHVIFQCKRYQGSVSSSSVRDFRGAMVGRADKGLFITTGTFTKDARTEAQRD